MRERKEKKGVEGEKRRNPVGIPSLGSLGILGREARMRCDQCWTKLRGNEEVRSMKKQRE